MKQVLPLFVFIDACGWEIVRNEPFAKGLAPYRKRLDSVFGYSSACVPSILSGRWPVEHRNWCYFVYDPSNSPFAGLEWLKWVPARITSRRIFRRWLSKWVQRRLGFKGYFDLYNIPFRHIGLFDFTEKRSPLQPGGMNRGPNIFDFLEERAIPYHCSDPAKDERSNLDALRRDISAEAIDFAFLYWPSLDGLLHRVGNDSSDIGPKLREYEAWIEELMREARAHYSEVTLHIFSDHGMANCDVHLDLKSSVEKLPLRFGEDYVVVYDSTMARFWCFTTEARRTILNHLSKVPEGRVLSDSELEDLGTLFADRYFGEIIFLVREGVLIVPSHMGERPIRAMHGYHPSEKHSHAFLCTNQPTIPEDIAAIPDMFRLMTSAAEEAHAANAHGPKAVAA